MSQEADYASMWADPTEDKARAYAVKYMSRQAAGLVFPAYLEPRAMLAGVHKARVAASDDPVIVATSLKWLTNNGFETEIDWESIT